MARYVATAAPCRINRKRARESLPEQLDMMVEKDDAMYLLYEARQRLEVCFRRLIQFCVHNPTLSRCLTVHGCSCIVGC